LTETEAGGTVTHNATNSELAGGKIRGRLVELGDSSHHLGSESMENNINDDPYNGRLAGITGRLAKLEEQVNWTRFAARPEEQMPSLLFMIGMLADLVLELTREVSALLPPEGMGV
jgi:hypothetical protein